MTNRNLQCANCGHLFSDEHPYYSEDFASYYSRSPIFALTWCYHCSYVTSYTQPLLAKIIRTPALKVKKTLPINKIDEEPLYKVRENEMGLFAGAHLMRMVWHCLNARIDLENSENSDNMESAVHLAMEKLSPREVALMVSVTHRAPEFVPLELQIEEGAYLKDRIPISSFESWISSSKKSKVIDVILEMVKEFSQM